MIATSGGALSLAVMYANAASKCSFNSIIFFANKAKKNADHPSKV
jgi:hypothetical protein